MEPSRPDDGGTLVQIIEMAKASAGTIVLPVIGCQRADFEMTNGVIPTDETFDWSTSVYRVMAGLEPTSIRLNAYRWKIFTSFVILVPGPRTFVRTHRVGSSRLPWYDRYSGQARV